MSFFEKLIVDNKTNLNIEVFHEINVKGSDTYRFSINGKPLILPIDSNPSNKISSASFILNGSLSITFERIETCVKITEIDPNKTWMYYFDDSRSVGDNIAYDVYNYVPRKIEKSEAVQKINRLIKSNSKFVDPIFIFNRHGIAALVFEGSYKLYYCNPQQDELRQLECRELDHNRTGDGTAKSKDRFVNFKYLWGRASYLNGEEAERIDQI